MEFTFYTKHILISAKCKKSRKPNHANRQDQVSGTGNHKTIHVRSRGTTRVEERLRPSPLTLNARHALPYDAPACSGRGLRSVPCHTTTSKGMLSVGDMPFLSSNVIPASQSLLPSRSNSAKSRRTKFMFTTLTQVQEKIKGQFIFFFRPTSVCRIRCCPDIRP